jgi:hypothetical protein
LDNFRAAASTDLRTHEGRAKIRAANTTHGFYTAESQAARRRTDTLIIETRALLTSLQRGDVPITNFAICPEICEKEG